MLKCRSGGVPGALAPAASGTAKASDGRPKGKLGLNTFPFLLRERCDKKKHKKKLTNVSFGLTYIHTP